jgi:hypothetical protein
MPIAPPCSLLPHLADAAASIPHTEPVYSGELRASRTENRETASRPAHRDLGLLLRPFALGAPLGEARRRRKRRASVPEGDFSMPGTGATRRYPSDAEPGEERPVCDGEHRRDNAARGKGRPLVPAPAKAKPSAPSPERSDLGKVGRPQAPPARGRTGWGTYPCSSSSSSSKSWRVGSWRWWRMRTIRTPYGFGR